MKTRRIWIVIVVILVVGICSTTYTKRYVEERGGGAIARSLDEAAGQAAMADAGPEAGLSEPEGAAAKPFAAELPQEDIGAGDPAAERAKEAETAVLGASEALGAADPSAVEEAALSDSASSLEEETATAKNVQLPGETAPEGVADQAAATRMGQDSASPQSAPVQGASPQAAAAAVADQGQETTAAAAMGGALAESQTAVVVAGGGKDKLQVSYKSRLEELDAQIERNRKADAEKSVANSVKARAENELKLWEAELDGIMKALEERLDSTQIENLYAEQREWRREKEAAALEAGKRQNGSALEEVGYSVSLADSTRKRAYELVEEYGAVLGE